MLIHLILATLQGLLYIWQLATDSRKAVLACLHMVALLVKTEAC